MLHVIFLSVALLSTGCSTEIIKVIVSRPRPSFYYLCNYKGYSNAVNSGNYTLYNELITINAIGNYDYCYNNNEVNNSISSFVSGHTSISFCSMLFTTFIVQKMFNIKNSFTLLGMFSYGFLIISAWIEITRIQDMRHHEDDIIGGVIVGLCLYHYIMDINGIYF